MEYVDPIQGPTVRYDWAKGEVIIKGLPGSKTYMLAFQQRLREIMNELERQQLIKAG